MKLLDPSLTVSLVFLGDLLDRPLSSMLVLNKLHGSLSVKIVDKRHLVALTV